jgi:hypothetical protein
VGSICLTSFGKKYIEKLSQHTCHYDKHDEEMYDLVHHDCLLKFLFQEASVQHRNDHESPQVAVLVQLADSSLFWYSQLHYENTVAYGEKKKSEAG